MNTPTKTIAALSVALLSLGYAATALAEHGSDDSSSPTPSPTATSSSGSGSGKTETPRPSATARPSETPRTSPTPHPSESPRPTLAPAIQKHVDEIEKKGGADIDKRVSSLSDLKKKIASMKRLSDKEKSELTKEIEDQSHSLTELKSSLGDAASVDAAKASFSQIFSDHYIYAFYQPRVNRIAAADAISSAATTLTNLATKLQGYVTTAKDNGTDVTEMQSKLDDMTAKAADAQAKAASVIATLTPLTAADFTKGMTVVKDQEAILKVARQDLETARKDAKAIVRSLRGLLGSSKVN